MVWCGAVIVCVCVCLCASACLCVANNDMHDCVNMDGADGGGQANEKKNDAAEIVC